MRDLVTHGLAIVVLETPPKPDVQTGVDPVLPTPMTLVGEEKSAHATSFARIHISIITYAIAFTPVSLLRFIYKPVLKGKRDANQVLLSFRILS